MSLVPCPFCGSRVSDVRPRLNTCQTIYFMRCVCGARGPEANSRSEAKELWARRESPAPHSEKKELRLPLRPRRMLS